METLYGHERFLYLRKGSWKGRDRGFRADEMRGEKKTYYKCFAQSLSSHIRSLSEVKSLLTNLSCKDTLMAVMAGSLKSSSIRLMRTMTLEHVINFRAQKVRKFSNILTKSHEDYELQNLCYIHVLNHVLTELNVL